MGSARSCASSLESFPTHHPAVHKLVCAGRKGQLLPPSSSRSDWTHTKLFLTLSSSSLPKYDRPRLMNRYANSKTSAALAFCGRRDASQLAVPTSVPCLAAQESQLDLSQPSPSTSPPRRLDRQRLPILLVHTGPLPTSRSAPSTQLTFFVTATSQRPPCRTWKKVVLPRVVRGEVGGVELAMT